MSSLTHTKFTGEAIRDLIAQGVIKHHPGIRGKPTKIDEVRHHTNPVMRRIRANYEKKVFKTQLEEE